MDVNDSIIMKCGFILSEIEDIDFLHIEKRIKKYNQEVVRLLESNYYYLELYYYDYMLGGELLKEITLYKCVINRGKHCWIASIDNCDYIRIDTLQDIMDVSTDIIFDDKLGFTYIIKSELGYKIGFSKSIHDRRKIFNVKMPFKWSFEDIYVLRRYKDMEFMLHQMLAHKKINGEWFSLSIDDLSLIHKLYLSLKSPT